MDVALDSGAALVRMAKALTDAGKKVNLMVLGRDQDMGATKLTLSDNGYLVVVEYPTLGPATIACRAVIGFRERLD
jgi:hypothetical protein